MTVVSGIIFSAVADDKSMTKIDLNTIFDKINYNRLLNDW